MYFNPKMYPSLFYDMHKFSRGQVKVRATQNKAPREMSIYLPWTIGVHLSNFYTKITTNFSIRYKFPITKLPFNIFIANKRIKNDWPRHPSWHITSENSHDGKGKRQTSFVRLSALSRSQLANRGQMSRSLCEKPLFSAGPRCTTLSTVTHPCVTARRLVPSPAQSDGK